MKNKKIIISTVVIVLVALTIAVFAFKNTTDNVAKKVTNTEYESWIKKQPKELEKIKATKEFGDITVSLSYIPAENRAIREVGSIKNQGFASALAEARKLMVYQLKISHKEGFDLLNTESPVYASYDSRVKYFAFDIQRKLKLSIGNEVKPCIMSHFERTYGSGNNIIVNLAFENEKISDLKADPIITWDDDFFGIGKINLSIGKNEIKSIPQIKS